ncbi:MAG: 30S ribosomal protein S11 [Candidatus Moraniibacteriota bacterium]
MTNIIEEQKKDIESIPEKVEVLDAENKTAIDTENKAEEKKKFKKAKKQVLKGRATIKCSYNNTIINISDQAGAVLGWSSSGLMGFKGAKKATPYAATQVVSSVAEKIKKYGVQELEVFVRGVGSGREASIRALANNGFEITMIKDTTPIPHNGCRAKKPRRI